ncbi:MAG: hypothetical protein HKN00_05410 [Flavobacteriaceae bacterium]|nr:hypothetical protein [Bacteroidia bacterium]NNF74600.1 hypothetical protein [Flavobacteriaceae bacterium]NNK73525.1 hypothetical protein [Flavobacteriaceae bacterium]
MTETNKPTTVFWVVSIVATIWNLLGVAAYLGNAFATDESIAALPQADQDYMTNMPAWVTAAFAIGVWFGLLACIGLLMRKKWAVPLFMLSLLGVLAQQVYNFFMQDYIDLSGSRMIMPVVVILVSIFLVWYSKDARTKGIIT